MAFRLATATAFAQGAWNIYILQPEWLREKGVLVTERPVVVQTLKAGPGLRLTTRGKRSPVWIATPFSVRVEFEKPPTGEDVGEPLTKLISALPETPLGQVGFELTYRGSAGEDARAVPAPPLDRGEPPAEYGASLMVEREGVTYDLYLSYAVADDSTHLVALCHQLQGRDLLRAYLTCEEEVRRIVSQYWRITL